ncbi:MAG: hypothetical protein VXZ27_07170, partial [SAR324 cluster bacterium]|nr:hypothetical protein [SAR324 cluster bacterium]
PQLVHRHRPAAVDDARRVKVAMCSNDRVSRHASLFLERVYVLGEAAQQQPLMRNVGGREDIRGYEKEDVSRIEVNIDNQ